MAEARYWLRSLLVPSAVAAAVVAAVVPLPGAAFAASPDVLIVSVDTLRADRLGAYGYRRNTSPNIDRLMADGVRFSQARTVEPLTAPALTSMVTALEPHEHAASRNGLRMRPDLVSVPVVFKRRGYETAAFVGNWTLRDKLLGLGEHFEHYVEVLDKHRWLGFIKREATAEDLTEQAVDWLADRDDDAPFFLWVHYVEPHAPYLLQEAFTAQVGSGDTADRRYRYDTEIAFVDHWVGRLLAKIPAGTVVVFVSDHGESLGEHDYWGHGRHLYEPTLHIPMSVTWRGELAPAVVDAPAMIHDIGPTLLGLADLPVPDFYQGYDWAPVLRDGAAAPADRVTYHQAHKGAVQRRDAPLRVRQQGLLEVARIEAQRKEILRVTNLHRWLFDLADDRLELDSLAPLLSDPTDDLVRWWHRVNDGLKRSDELPPPVLDDADLDALRDLGYID